MAKTTMTLCPCLCFVVWWSLRKLSDSSQLFTSLNKPHKRMTSSSFKLARWMKDILQDHGVNT